MNNNKHAHRHFNFAEIIVSYLAFISFFFVLLYQRFEKWKLFIDHYVKFKTLLIVLAVASLLLLYRKRHLVLSLFKTDAVRYGILFLAAVLGLYFRFHVTELFIFLYTVYAILFIRYSLETNRLYAPARKLTNNILDALFDVESRTPALLALLLLVSLPFLLIVKKTSAAESTAIYVYYLLVITVILQILEVKLGIEKENRLLAYLTDAFHRTNRAVKERERRAQIFDAAYKLARQVFTIRNVSFVAVLLATLAGLYAAKNSYWKTVMHAVNSNAAYRSELILNVGDKGSYTFPSYAEEITVPVRIKHPFSNPLWWPNTGANAVSVGILWFSGNKTGALREKIFEDYQPIPRPLFINESSDISVKLKRPFLPGDRTYEVWIGLVFDGNRWFSERGDSVLKLNVQMERLSGAKAIDYERKTYDLIQKTVEEEMSHQLSFSANDYRSKIEIMQDTLLTPASTHRVSITNRGGLPWPVYSQHAVKLGVVWVQKIIENGNDRFIHLAEDTYPLSQVVSPGKSVTVDLSVDPRKEQEADEIWIGMVHEGKTWFYSGGDAVIKLPNMSKQPIKLLADLRRKNELLEKELIRLRDRTDSSSGPHDGRTLLLDTDYRSRIGLVHDESKNRSMAFADRIPLDLEITNTGNVPWIPSDEHAVNLGIRWYKKSGSVAFDSPIITNERCIFPFSVLKDVTVRMQCMIGEKVLPGKYEVWIGPVQEGITWFYEKEDNVLKLNVAVQ